MHPQDSSRPNTPHELYRRLWSQALAFLNTGDPGLDAFVQWRAEPGSSWEWGPFHEHHDEARAQR